MSQVTSTLLRLLPALALTVLLVGAAASPAAAHQPGATSVVVRSGGGSDLELTAQIPLSRLDFAYGTHLADDPVGQVSTHRAWLSHLLTGRVALSAADGRAWTLRVEDLRPDRAQGKRTVRAILTATAPAGAAGDEVELRWDVVTDVVYTHLVYVGGRDTDGAVQLVGVLTHQADHVDLQVDAPADGAATVSAMLALGFEHFRAGLDHQLFLTLLALGVVRRRAGWRGTARLLTLLTVTFTVGHSVSLALATLGWVTLPSRWVETAIAATILLTAVHAARPRLRLRAEVALTALFGLVHGFGFAGTLRDLELHGTELLRPVLSFNLGLEAAQLAALALILGPLWWLSRSPAATRVLTVAVGLTASSWILQRAVGLPTPIDGLAAEVLGSPERLAVALLVGATLAALARRLLPSAQAAAIGSPKATAMSGAVAAFSSGGVPRTWENNRDRL